MIKHFKYSKEGECVWRAISIGFAGTNKTFTVKLCCFVSLKVGGKKDELIQD